MSAVCTCGVVEVNNCCACVAQQGIRRFSSLLSRIIQGMAEMKILQHIAKMS